MPHFREGTNDLGIWDLVNGRNEYGLPRDLTGKIVLDIGAHIGSFSAACLDRGAATVISVEASPENFEYLKKNTKEYGDRSICLNRALAAMGGQTVKVSRVSPHNTGAVSVGDNLKEFHSVETVDLAIIPYRHRIERVDVLKLDCEGAEWAALSTARAEFWNTIQEITGEYHVHMITLPIEELRTLSADLTLEDFAGLPMDRRNVLHQMWLRTKLQSFGFQVWTEPLPGDPRAGHFHAYRDVPLLKTIEPDFVRGHTLPAEYRTA